MSGLWLKHYDRLNLFTDHSLQNVPDDILVLVDKFLVQNGLVNSKWHDDPKSIFEALVLGGAPTTEPMRNKYDETWAIR